MAACVVVGCPAATAGAQPAPYPIWYPDRLMSPTTPLVGPDPNIPLSSADRTVIAIEGGIGAGKTTTASLVADLLAVPAILEDTDRHPFLPAFYAHPSKYALETELGFVLLHAHELKRVEAPLCIADFSITKDLVFAKLSLQGEEFAVFQSVYEWATNSLGKPRLVIFLDIAVETMLQRIRMRGRSFELGISEAYLARLATEYHSHMDALGDEVVRFSVQVGANRDDVARAIHTLVSDWL